MCGIAIILPRRSDVPAGAIERMTASLSHRGPDAVGLLRLPGCQLGHRRLAVLDLETGDQPMSETSGRFSIVFNGEIYNHRELRSALTARGHRFHTRSDTEVILRAFQEFGDTMPGRLKGQFAFAIWDAREHCLFAARDRFGEKPLYWSEADGGALLLASEIRALLASGLFRPHLDVYSVAMFLALGYVPPDRTIYTNVHTLEPGSAARWLERSRSLVQYWRPTLATETNVDFQEAASEVQRLVRQAVQRQLVADVPVGAFLSGGLDSSTLVAVMAEQMSRPVETFSAGFGDLINELPFARDVANGLGTAHHEIQIPIPLEEMLHRMAEVYDEPFGDSSNIPTYLLAEFARRDVKVAISGDGGDEVFGGYDWYAPLLAGDSQTTRRRLAILFLRQRLLRALTAFGVPASLARDRAVEAYSESVADRRYREPWIRHVAGTLGVARDRSKMWAQRVAPPLEDTLRDRYLPSEESEAVDQAVFFDLSCYLPGDILVKVDRATMAHGLETRAPLLDPDLTEFVLSLPARLRFAGGQPKALLRAAFGHRWPSSVRGRANKQGFGAPIRAWLEDRAVRSLVNHVRRPDGPLVALLPGLPKTWARRDDQEKWRLLCLGLWLERHAECLYSPR
jgi:asparagine synthase (glutamine-hydrolysing)